MSVRSTGPGVGLVYADRARRRQLEALLGPHAGVALHFSVDALYEVLARLTRSGVAVVFVEAAQLLEAGEGALRLLGERSASVRVVALTAGESEADILNLLRAGAMGFLDPLARPDLLAKAAHAVAAGEAWVPRRTVAALIEWLVETAPPQLDVAVNR